MAYKFFYITATIKCAEVKRKEQEGIQQEDSSNSHLSPVSKKQLLSSVGMHHKKSKSQVDNLAISDPNDILEDVSLVNTNEKSKSQVDNLAMKDVSLVNTDITDGPRNKENSSVSSETMCSDVKCEIEKDANTVTKSKNNNQNLSTPMHNSKPSSKNCPYCSKTYVHKSSLFKHMKNKHRDDKENRCIANIQCNRCESR